MLRTMLLCGLLSACAGQMPEELQASRRTTVSVAAACETIGNAEVALAPFVARMDDRAIATLNASRALARPWCGAAVPSSNLAAAGESLTAALANFTALKAAWSN